MAKFVKLTPITGDSTVTELWLCLDKIESVVCVGGQTKIFTSGRYSGENYVVQESIPEVIDILNG